MRCLLVLVLVACDPSRAEQPTSSPSPASPITRIDVRELLAKFECNRCHEVPESLIALPEKQCFGCHQQIHDGTFDAKAEAITRWQKRIRSLRYAPSLAVADRLRRRWVKQFLLHPHDVRPGSIAEMPRLAVSDAEAGQLARFLVPVDDSTAAVVSDAPQRARGEQLFRTFACGRCHRFTGASVDNLGIHELGQTLGATSNELTRPPKAWVLAPDLQFARARVQPAQLASWIARPRGAMPNLGVSDDDALALAAFITSTPLAPIAAQTTPSRLPVLTREVTWAEVSTKVFHDQCWHCHAVPDFARGDGGPGNSGGFGFRPRGLDLSSYTGISQGSLDDDGERRSIFEKRDDGTPRVIAQLMARHVEEAGGEVVGLRGMPLGLPALSLEQIQLVESWIAQGRPQ